VDKLRLAPRIPAGWGSFKIHYRYRETFYHISVEQVEKTPEPVVRATLDGVDLDQEGRGQTTIPLVDDRRDHYVEVRLS
jgi:cyclic beta-1,2-glucan synthetase